MLTTAAVLAHHAGGEARGLEAAGEARVVRRNGEYYIKDLGSTNGIEFAGQRVDDHRVEEGNVYYLCDHEIRFTFQPPY